MRLIKMFGLTAIAALATMAFIGAGSASAITLCKEAQNASEECPAGKRYPSGTVLKASLVTGTKAVLLSNLGTIECNKAETAGKTSEESGSPLKGQIETVTFSECEVEGVPCTVTTENLPYTALLLLEPAGSYHLIVHNGKALVVCAGVINCKFGAAEILFSQVNLPLAEDVDLKVLQELERSSTGLIGAICPSTAVWHAEYLVSTPHPLFVAMNP
jgi:hypothetical protein